MFDKQAPQQYSRQRPPRKSLSLSLNLCPAIIGVAVQLLLAQMPESLLVNLWHLQYPIVVESPQAFHRKSARVPHPLMV